MEFKRKLEKVKEVTLKKPYSYYFMAIFFGYILLNLLINQVYVNLPTLTEYSNKFLIPFIIFTFLLVPGLVAVTVNLAIVKFKDLKQVKEAKGGKTGGFAALGIFAGVVGGACPGCFVGLFPALLGLFGLSASLSILPFYGLEIQLASSILLLVSIGYLTRDTVCIDGNIALSKEEAEKIIKGK